jgi:ribonuclease D
LSDACEKILGKPLYKNQQLSPWNARPLTSAQLKYAALDAHCLLAILETLLLTLGAKEDSDQINALHAYTTQLQACQIQANFVKLDLKEQKFGEPSQITPILEVPKNSHKKSRKPNITTEVPTASNWRKMFL